LSLTGEPDIPLKLYGNQTYYTASLFAVNGVLLALYERRSSGKGQHLDISVMECVVATLDRAIPAYLSGENTSNRQGSRYGNNAFRVFRCQDGYILLSFTQHWDTLVEWLDSEGMADDLTNEKWRNSNERNLGIDYIIDVLERWALKHTIAELEEKGQLMHFPWAGVRSVSQLLESPQLKERDYFTEIDVAYTGERYRTTGAAVKMSDSFWQPGSRLALPGESNRDIFQGELGLTADDMELLSIEGII
jgi:crotonobetainyl-CoA:carnitine CoA-transferase CaiB-like acyl-CoA transferase